jgi:hypothetical protein
MIYAWNMKLGGPQNQSGNFGKQKNCLPLTDIEFCTIQLIMQLLHKVYYPGYLLVGLTENSVPIMNTALRASFSGKIYMRKLSLKHPPNINFIFDNENT